MLKDFFHKLYDFLKRVLSSRIFALALVFTGMFLILAVAIPLCGNRQRKTFIMEFCWEF